MMYWPKKNWDLIECAFEVFMNIGGAGCDEQDKIAAKAFGKRYEDDEARLEAILNNIIENGGLFKP